MRRNRSKVGRVISEGEEIAYAGGKEGAIARGVGGGSEGVMWRGLAYLLMGAVINFLDCFGFGNNVSAVARAISIGGALACSLTAQLVG